MFMYFYENGYESRLFATEAEAEDAYADIEAEIASDCGYCDPDYLMLCEVEE